MDFWLCIYILWNTIFNSVLRINQIKSNWNQFESFESLSSPRRIIRIVRRRNAETQKRKTQERDGRSAATTAATTTTANEQSAYTTRWGFRFRGAVARDFDDSLRCRFAASAALLPCRSVAALCEQSSCHLLCTC